MSNDQTWRRVDCQSDLDAFDSAVCWEDSETLEFYGSSRNERYFPEDISRSGYQHPNLHLWCRVDSPHGEFLHIVLVDCDRYCSGFISSPYFRGQVDSLRRIEVHDARGTIQMRCSRLIYRFSRDDGSIASPYLPLRPSPF